MLDYNDWAVKAIIEMGYTPEQARDKVVEMFKEHNMCEEELACYNKPVDEINSILWEVIYSILLDPERFKEKVKLFDLSSLSGAMRMSNSYLD